MRPALIASLLFLGCAPSATVPLLGAAGVPITVTPTGAVPLEVLTRGTNVADPMPVKGSNVTYADVETALGHAISSATVPWADAHRSQRPDGWQLSVELVEAEARYEGERLKVTLTTSATLRTRGAHEYLGQTRAVCNEGALVAEDKGAPVIYTCMTRIGRDIAAWLGSVEP